MRKQLTGLTLFLLVFVSQLAAGTATVDATTKYQTISGFGASSQWVESKITSSLATAFWADDSVNGHAGLSIIRLGIDDSGNSNWGTACGSATQALNINPNVRVFASPWSPPAKWKNNNATTGNNTGNTNGNPGSNTNQLSTSHYGDYATYLTNFVKACKSTYGFTPYAISVQNEPDYDVTYDSCLWSASAFDSFIGTYLGPDLAAAGFNNIIMMPESFACNMSLAATTMSDSNAAKYVRAIGQHLYGGGPNPIPASYSTTAGHTVELWETETSEKTSDGNIDSGIYYANQLHKCIVDNNYNAYCYWWLVNMNSDDEGLCDSSGNPTKRLYTMGNYSKFVKPGYVRIGATEAPTSGLTCSAYQDPVSGKFAIVVINQNSSATSQQFNLNGLSASSVTPWITDANNNLVAQSAVSVSGNSFTFSLPAQSVMSFVGTSGGVTPVPTTPVPTSTPTTPAPTNTPTKTNTPVGPTLTPTTPGPTSTPVTPSPTPTPVVKSTWRVNAGGSSYTDGSGNVWAADENYNTGTAKTITNTISNTTDQTLYQSERYGSPFTYTFNVPAGSYQVTLKFCETYQTASGARVFAVSINGTQVLSNFDIFADSGAEYKADDKTFSNISASNGKITIQFGPASADNAQVCAIQIIPQPATPSATPTTPVPTNTFTNTFTKTNTAIPPTNTFTNTFTATNTPLPPTNTFTNTFTKTNTPITPSPTPTTPVPTNTVIVPSPTSQVPSNTPTNTSVPPTNTPITPSPTPTTPVPTNTPVTPSATPTTPIPTYTPITPSPTPTTPVPTIVPTTPVPTNTPAVSLKFMLKSADTNNSSSSPHPQIRVINSGSSAASLNNIEVRYWFNCDCTGQSIQAFIDYAGKMPQGLSLGSNAQISVVASARGNQTDYLSFKFTGNITLQPGEYVEVQARFNKSDWSAMTQSNDWSFSNSQNWLQYTQLTGYSGGVLIWGQEPPVSQNTVQVANVMTYPNPATSATGATLQYTINAPNGGVATADAAIYVPDPSTKVYLRIYTISGRLIWQQVVEGVYYVSTGDHRVFWDGKAPGGHDLSAGSYILQVELREPNGVSRGYSTILMLK
jgi:glucuronoarabinoxylan endo-1,4-beta-xylanase